VHRPKNAHEPGRARYPRRDQEVDLAPGLGGVCGARIWRGQPGFGCGRWGVGGSRPRGCSDSPSCGGQEGRLQRQACPGHGAAQDEVPAAEQRIP
jgi:hypothetical protein